MSKRAHSDHQQSPESSLAVTRTRQMARNNSQVASERLLGELRSQIVASHRQCVAAMECAVKHAANAGRQLLAARAFIGHGRWTTWVEENFSEETGLSKRTAERYMSLVKNLDRLIADYRLRQSDDTTQLSQIDDDEIFRHYSLTQAYKITSPTQKSRDPGGYEVIQKARPNIDWLTPAEIVEASSRLLKEIECDPCAADGVDNFSATTRYREGKDGLRPDATWGRTALVSPGQSDDTQRFVEKAMQLFQDGELEEAVLVLPFLADSTWMETLRLFPRAFLKEQAPVQVAGESKQVRLNYPLAIVFVGPVKRFASFASEFCTICQVFLPYGE